MALASTDFIRLPPPASVQQQPHSRRRRSENGLAEGHCEIMAPIVGIYRHNNRKTSFNGTRTTDETTVAPIDDSSEDEEATGQEHAMTDEGEFLIDDRRAENNDEDDDVFEEPIIVRQQTDDVAQYDDLSAFASSVQQPEEFSSSKNSRPLQTSSESNAQSLQSTKKRVVAERKNDTSVREDSSTTSTLVDNKNNNDNSNAVRCKSQNHQRLQNVSSACSRSPEPSVNSPGGISLLDKLVRTSPIWFLPHVGRLAAMHFLRGKPPGVFIVRQSSQPHSMALSIKLPPGAAQDIEHYIIETTRDIGTTTVYVRLQGSPRFFNALPLLLAYYCENGDELHTTLALPPAIANCESPNELYSLGLLGQDFWSYKHCWSERSQSSASDALLSPSNFGPKQPPPSPPTRLKEINIKKELLADETEPTAPHVDIPNENQLQPVHRRSLSLSGYPSSAKSPSRGLSPLTSSILQHVHGAFRKPSLPSSSCRAAKPPVKERSLLSKFRSESVSSALAPITTKLQQQPEHSQHPERRSFRLKSLFETARRPGGQPSGESASQNQTISGSSGDKKTQQPALDNSCTSNMPKMNTDSLKKKPPPSSASSTSMFYVRRPAPAPPALLPRQASSAMRDPDPSAVGQLRSSNGEEHEYYYFSPAASSQSPVLGAVVTQSKSVSSLLHEAMLEDEQQFMDTPTLARRRLLTFKPASPAGGNETEPSSASTTLERASVKSVSKPAEISTQENRHQSAPPMEIVQKTQSSNSTKFQPLLRREKSDLGWFGVTEKQRPSQAILPPENKEHTFKTCVEELRRRRLEAVRQQKGLNLNAQTSLQSRKDGSAHTVTTAAGATAAKKNSPTPPAGSSTNSATSILRPKSTRRRDQIAADGAPSHRLSAPNLADATAGVCFRPPKNPPLGGALHTINEGLVTPMARRRWALQKRQQSERRLSQSLEDLSDATPASEISKPFPMSIFDRKCSSERSSKSKNGENVYTKSEKRHESYSPYSSGSAASRRNVKAFHDETNFQWLAVTDELSRNRHQNVAKVQPCASGHRGDVSSKYSDYVMLNECADILADLEVNRRPGKSQQDDEYACRYGSIGVNGETSRQDSYNSTNQAEALDVDDTRSVVSAAGTVFNEPWDSSLWDNLLSLATSMDTNEKPIDEQNNSNKSSQQIDFENQRISSSSSVTTGTNLTSNFGAVTKAVRQKEKAPVAVPSKEIGENGNRKTNPSSGAFAERLKKLKENNIPPPLAPNWEEFSAFVPLSSDSSLPTSTPTNSLEGKRKSKMFQGDSEREKGDPFHLAPVGSPLRFHTHSNNNTDSGSGRRNRIRRQNPSDPGLKIQDCVEKLAEDSRTFFGSQVQFFIKCTTEGHETNPLAVLGNVRQFMNGVKNYLVKHGECDLHQLIEHERSKLRLTEFLNIDAILEGVLQKVILAPLKPHLYQLLVKDSSGNGSLETLSENLAVIRNKPTSDLGVTVDGCDSTVMEQVRSYLRKMQHHYSPLKKLEYLLHAVSLAYDNRNGRVTENCQTSACTGHLPAADELLRWFVFLLSRCSMVGCEIESIYMWNLLHPVLLAGEASYYLTAFSSAVHVMKNMELLPKLNDACSLSTQVGDGGESFIRLAVPDEINGAIEYHCFPAMPQLTVARLCRMIARKCGITNPEDHGLYLLVDGYETCLLPTEYPEFIKEQLRASNKPHIFAYKRHEAKIAWPKVAMSPRL